MTEHIMGLVAAPFTPFGPDGEVNLEVIDRQAARLVADGVVGAFICGTTGEGLSLTVDERRSVARRWADVVGDDLRLIVHVGHNSLPAARALAAHARQIGAGGIGITAPCYYRPATTADLVDFCAAVAAEAPELDVYFYHVPVMTGVSVKMLEFLPRAAERMPNFVGVKYTLADLHEFGQCLTLDGGRYDMLFGRDEMLLAALALGARGAVGSTYNFAAPLYRGIIEAFEAGDMETARARQAVAGRMLYALMEAGLPASGKAAMKMAGIDCGPPRLPLRALDEQAYRKCRQRLRELGVLA